MKIAQAMFGALAAALGLAAVVTFYDEIMLGTQTPPHPKRGGTEGGLLTPASSIAHDFAVLPKFVHATPTSSISEDSAVLPKSVRTVPVVRGSTPQPALGAPPQQSTAKEIRAKTCNRPRGRFSSVATTLSSRAEPLDVCAQIWRPSRPFHARTSCHVEMRLSKEKAMTEGLPRPYCSSSRVTI